MTTKIQKWGNSLAVRLPKAVFTDAVFGEGSAVQVERQKDGIFLKMMKDKQPTLKEVLRGMTRANFEPELDWGPDVGNEILK